MFQRLADKSDKTLIYLHKEMQKIQLFLLNPMQWVCFSRTAETHLTAHAHAQYTFQVVTFELYTNKQVYV